MPAESGDLSVKIKDIVSEGFASSFGKALLPSQLQTTLQTLKANKRPLDPTERTELGPEEVELAKSAQEKYGDNPESVFPGFIGWLTQQQQDSIADYKETIAKQKDVERRRKEQAQAKQTKGKRRLAKDVFGVPAQPAPAQSAPVRSAPAQPAPAQPAPPQVRLSSGEYITKYGGSWYNEQGQQITQPGDIASLERRTQAPAGQSQMATTKNVPVALPGFKGKRR